MVKIPLCVAITLMLTLLAQATHSVAQVSMAESQAKLEFVIENKGRPVLEREMVLATLRGTYSINMTLEEIAMPRMRDLEWVQLDRSQWRAAVVDGRSVRIMERHYALFPQHSGRVTIRPAIHTMTIVDPAGRRSALAVKSKPVVLDVAKADAAPGDWWLPAKALEIRDSWESDPAALGDGDSVKRTVVLTVLGATEQMIPPQPAMRQPWMITFTDPEERTMTLTSEGPLTTVTWRWTLRPKTGEPGVLPEVTIPWFDTTERKSKTASLKAQPFGYAGFGNNTATQWQSGFSGIASAAALFLAGLILPLLLFSPRGRLRPLAEIAASFRQLLPGEGALNLQRAARGGNPAAIREAARAVTACAPAASRGTLEALLHAFDRKLFGPGGGATRTDARAFAKAFKKAVR